MKQTCPGCYRQWPLSVSKLVREADREARSCNKGTEGPRRRLPNSRGVEGCQWASPGAIGNHGECGKDVWLVGVAGGQERRPGQWP